MRYADIERRLEHLERLEQAQATEASLTARLAGLDPETRKAIEGIRPVDRERWMSGMEWFGSLPGDP